MTTNGSQKALLVDFGGVLTTDIWSSFADFCEQRGLDAEAAHAIASAMRRLIAPQAMGELFKVLALRSPDWPEPAGF